MTPDVVRSELAGLLSPAMNPDAVLARLVAYVLAQREHELQQALAYLEANTDEHGATAEQLDRVIGELENGLHREDPDDPIELLAVDACALIRSLLPSLPAGDRERALALLARADDLDSIPPSGETG